jgi:hypothetical protein
MLIVVALVGVAVTVGMGGVEGMSVGSSGAKSVATTAKTGASIVRNVASIGGKGGPEREPELSADEIDNRSSGHRWSLLDFPALWWSLTRLGPIDSAR